MPQFCPLMGLVPSIWFARSNVARIGQFVSLCVLFARQFCGSPSSHHIWEDDAGVVRTRGRRRTRGPHDAVVVLFGTTCGIHGGPEPVGGPRGSVRVLTPFLQAELWRHSRIRVHGGRKLGMHPNLRCVQQGATFQTVQVMQSIQNSTPSGAVIDPRTRKASKCWVRLLATKIL